MGLLGALGLLGATSCRNPPLKKEVPVEASVVEVTPDAVVVRVKTTPGIHVSFGMTEDGSGTPVDKDGIAQLSMPRAVWERYSDRRMNIAAGERTLLRETYGSVDVDLPASFKHLTQIRKAENGLWFAVVGGDYTKTESDALPFWVGDEPNQIVIHTPRDATGITVVVASPKNAQLAVAARHVDVAPTGLTELTVPFDDVALATNLDGIGEKIVANIPVTVSADGASETYAFKLVPSYEAIDPMRQRLVARIARVAKGAPFPTVRDSANVTVYLRAREIVPVGPAASLGQARFIAISEVTTRKGARCGPYMPYYDYKTAEYDDEEIHVYDAGSGRELAKRTFKAPTVPCPESTMSDSIIGSDVPRDTIVQWLQTGMEKGWK